LEKEIRVGNGEKPIQAESRRWHVLRLCGLDQPPEPFQSNGKIARCIHHKNEAIWPECQLGILYDEVRVPDGRTYRLPCIPSEGVSDRCPQFSLKQEAGHGEK
jgi:hypothetical protein